MKVAFVVQRYGLEINGGAELHCRWVAEHMRKYWDVEVLTTRAADYITWKNHYPKGTESINGVTVHRFSVTRPRDPERFGRLQNRLLTEEHRLEDERRWLEEEGPLSPSLIEHIETHQDEYDYFIFFSYRYFHSYWGIHTIPHKSILVPTAEKDAITVFSIFRDLFRLPRAFVYNSYEERAMIHGIAGNEDIPGDVVGVGTVVPQSFETEAFLKKYDLKGDYVIYIGRIDENKGCAELFDFFIRMKKKGEVPFKLILCGSTKLKIPVHPDILYLGFVSEEEKFAALNGARALIMPSFYESLSMVTLEAWAMGKPVLANARCDVLQGQCRRSNAGLYYADYNEFRESLHLLLSDSRLCDSLGRNGKTYFQNNYTWDVIEQKYIDIVGALKQETE
jgi:glycosyltransferase involved in cell wall biosynthesis